MKSRRNSRPRKMASASTSPTATAAVVAHAEPAIPQPSRKMNTSFSTAFRIASTAITSSVMRVRLMPLKKLVTAQAAMPTGPPSRRGSQYATASASISGASPKGPEQPRAAQREHCKERDGQQRRPQPAPHGARRTVTAPRAVGLRDERLHAHPHPAEQQDEHEHQVIDGAERRGRVGGQPPDEPCVGQAENGLDARVQDQRHREREHGAHAHAAPALRVEPQRGKRGCAGRAIVP